MANFIAFLATDSTYRIIYETDTGKLFCGTNGSAVGGRAQSAQVAAGLG